MTHLLRLFSKSVIEYDYLNELKHKCRVRTNPVYFNAELARMWLATSPF